MALLLIHLLVYLYDRIEDFFKLYFNHIFMRWTLCKSCFQAYNFHYTASKISFHITFFMHGFSLQCIFCSYLKPQFIKTGMKMRLCLLSSVYVRRRHHEL